MDLYDTNAEYYDAVSAPMWDALRAPLARALAPLAATTGPLVDLGAGTGGGTGVLATAAPGREVLAVEPSPALRIALMARLVADADLRSRVTVLPTDADGALRDGLPDRIGGLAALHVLGHLGPATRARLWRMLSERLEPSGLTAVLLQAPPEAVSVPQQAFGEGVRVGRRTYRSSGGAEPSGEDQVTWSMCWQVLEDGAVVDERTASTTWWTVSPARLAAEASAASLRCTPADEALGLYLLHPAGER